MVGAELGPTPGKRRAVLTADRRRRLLLSARASLLDVHFFEKDSDVYHVLSATDTALDHTDRPLRHWELLQSSFRFSRRETAIYRCSLLTPLLLQRSRRLQLILKTADSALSLDLTIEVDPLMTIDW